MPNTQSSWRLNWASFGLRSRAAGDGGSVTEGVTEFSIFVGDLAPEVSDGVLLETFRSLYTSVCTLSSATASESPASCALLALC